MSVEGMPTERSFGGRDTPDTTRSISGCSTNLSSKDDGVEYCGSRSSQSTPMRKTSTGGEEKNMLLQFISSPKRLISSPKVPKSAQVNGLVTPVRRKKDISSPVLRSSFSGWFFWEFELKNNRNMKNSNFLKNKKIKSFSVNKKTFFEIWEI